jgi:hypothetical protein
VACDIRWIGGTVAPVSVEQEGQWPRYPLSRKESVLRYPLSRRVSALRYQLSRRDSVLRHPFSWRRESGS